MPERGWIGKLSRSYPEARFRILAALSVGSNCVGLLEIISPDRSSVLTDLQQYEAIVEIHILNQREEEAFVLFNASAFLLLSAIRKAELPVELPLSIIDSKTNLEITAPQDQLSKLRDQLEELDIQFDVQQIRHQIEIGQSLSDTQLRLIRAAVEYGYYDTPRACSLTELANEHDLAKSTCSETLHRAEEKIIKQFIGDDFATLSDKRIRP